MSYSVFNWAQGNQVTFEKKDIKLVKIVRL